VGHKSHLFFLPLRNPMTIHLEPNTENTFVIFTDKSELVNPTWLFVIRDERSLNSYWSVILPNTSTTSRWGKFILDLPTDMPELTEGGDYRYELYEQESTENLVPELATRLVKQGIAELDVQEFTYSYSYA
jgi:hypothetical protein